MAETSRRDGEIDEVEDPGQGTLAVFDPSVDGAWLKSDLYVEVRP